MSTRQSLCLWLHQRFLHLFTAFPGDLACVQRLYAKHLAQTSALLTAMPADAVTRLLPQGLLVAGSYTCSSGLSSWQPNSAVVVSASNTAETACWIVNGQAVEHVMTVDGSEDAGLFFIPGFVPLRSVMHSLSSLAKCPYIKADSYRQTGQVSHPTVQQRGSTNAAHD